MAQFVDLWDEYVYKRSPDPSLEKHMYNRLNKYIVVSIFFIPILYACSSSELVPTTASIQTEAQSTSQAPVEEASQPINKEPRVEFLSMTLASGQQLEYGLVLPANFDPQQTYPILLLLPPGGQTEDMVGAGFGFFADGAINNGWIILSPVAPDGVLFFQGSETLIPEFLAKTAEQYKPEGGKYHVAGISNGGISAFRIATSYPDQVHSLLALPGFPRGDDKNNLDVLMNIPVYMFVGETDAGWVGAMQDAETSLKNLGTDVTLQIMEGEGHVIQSLGDGVILYELLEGFRGK